MSNDKLIKAAEKALEALNFDAAQGYRDGVANELQSALAEARKDAAKTDVDKWLSTPEEQVHYLSGKIDGKMEAHYYEPAEQQGEQEPFIFVHELLANGGGIWIGCADRSVVEKSYDEGEVGEEIIPLYTHPDRVKAEPLTEDDVFTLMGHAIYLHGNGETDMPNYFFSLSERIAKSIGDDALAKRAREVATAHGIEVQQEGE